MSDKFRIAETDNFSKNLKKFRSVYNKLSSNVYPQLKLNPFFGKNIKKLKGDLDYIYRYRIGRLRLFYTFDKGSRTVFILDIDYRKDVYKRK